MADPLPWQQQITYKWTYKSVRLTFMDGTFNNAAEILSGKSSVFSYFSHSKIIFKKSAKN